MPSRFLGVALAALVLAGCGIGGSDSDPSPSPRSATGANYFGWANERATRVMKRSDVELDDAKRVEQIHEVGKLAAKDIVGIPLFAKPQALAVNTRVVTGDFDFNAGPAGFAHKLKSWDVENKELSFGAEQWPSCLNPLTECGRASWLFFTAILPTQAQLLNIDEKGEYVPSPLVREVPSIANGQVTQKPFTVTYNLNPNARWEDGTKITGEDIAFTLEAIRKTPGVLTKSAYEDIQRVSTEGDKVTLHFKRVYAPWRDLFGGPSGVVLKKAAFPDPNLEGKMLRDLAGVSGGPFKLDSFDENQMTLSRNPNFWGEQAKLDRVIFRKTETAQQQLDAYRQGSVHALFPQPTIDLINRLRASAGTHVQVKAGTVYEGIWFNLDAFPVNDRAVREALLYGIDRQQIVDTVIKPIDPSATVNTCMFSVKGLAQGRYCGEDVPVEFNTDKAVAALTKGGWKKQVDPNDDKKITGWSKGGRRLVIRLATTAGNAERERIQLMIAIQLANIGVELRSDNSLAESLFRTRLPARDFTSGMFGFPATPDPSVTGTWSKDEIPGVTGVGG